MTWYRLLESQLTRLNRPNIRMHMKLGDEEWNLNIDLEKYWHLIPITGYEAFDIRDPDIGSLTYRNQPLQEMTNAGLIVVGQLFPVDELGRVNATQTKSYSQIEQEWNIRIPISVRNSITVLVNIVKRRHRDTLRSQLKEAKTTLESMIRAGR